MRQEKAPQHRRLAVINTETGAVINVVAVHPSWPNGPEPHHTWEPPEGHGFHLLPPGQSPIGIGWRHWSGSLFYHPAERQIAP